MIASSVAGLQRARDSMCISRPRPSLPGAPAWRLRSKPMWFHSHRRGVGVAAELVARQQLAVLVALVRLDHGAADFDEADRARSRRGEIGAAARGPTLRGRRSSAGRLLPLRPARAERRGPRPVAHHASANGRGEGVVGGVAHLVIDDECDARRPRQERSAPRPDRRRGTRAGSGYGLRSPGREARGGLRAAVRGRGDAIRCADASWPNSV